MDGALIPTYNLAHHTRYVSAANTRAVVERVMIAQSSASGYFFMPCGAQCGAGSRVIVGA